MSKQEKEIRKFAEDFRDMMKWDFPIDSVKVSQMSRYKGLCVSDGEFLYFNISEKTHETNKDFFATVIHELIHAQLLVNWKFEKAHKHGRKFQKLAKKVERKTNGFYTVEEIV